MMKARWWRAAPVMAVVMGAGVAPVEPVAERAEATTVARSTDLPTDRVIVFFDGSPVSTAVLNESTDETDLGFVRSVSREIRVYRTSDAMSAVDIARLEDDLSSLPNVTEVRADTRVELTVMSLTDPYYALYQHALYGTYGMNVEPAWSMTKGAGVNVAVIDNGIIGDHPDLAANIVGGHDFVSSDGTTLSSWPYVPPYFTANDGDGWDTDPSDPGDWGETDAEFDARKDKTTAENLTRPPDNPLPMPSRECAASNSSWHGTHVAGTVAALQNNGIGVTGVAPLAKVVPVRALGRCGGRLSDLLAAMRWAVGLAVTGAPSNPHPARVLNMSLGAPDTTCSGELATVVNELTAAGALLVAATGNLNVNAAYTYPSNCSNVLAVSAVSDNGARASFSNYGSVVDISAPGEGILSTSNLGTTVPGSNTYRFMSGTSMSSPHVAGTAALALAVNPSLTVSELRSALTGHTTSFAPDSLPLPVLGDTQYPTCNMSASCGSGILNAGSAVSYVSQNIRPGSPLNVTALRAGRNVTVSWATPATSGSSAITGYVVMADGTDACTTPDGTTLSCTITNMALGTHTFTVQAMNSVGRGQVSAPSDSITVVVAPSSVREVTALRNGQSITVSWMPPLSDGGLPVDYVVSGGPNGQVATVDTSATFTNLTVGSSHSFSVMARNSEGVSEPVLAPTVTVYSVPSAARNVSAARSGQSVTVAWEAPLQSGGLPLTYTVSAGPGGSITTSGTTHTFTNLAPGIIYTFWVTAENSEGAAYAEPSPPVGVYSAPSQVRNASAVATYTSATLSWAAPAQTGGLGLSYVISGGPGGNVSTASTSQTFTSLQQGVTYFFSIVAVNAEGSAPVVNLPAVTLPVPPTTTVRPTTTTTIKPLPPLTKLARGSKTLLTRIHTAAKGSSTKWYASGPCFIRSTRVVATRTKGTCRLTVVAKLNGTSTRKIFRLKVV